MLKHDVLTTLAALKALITYLGIILKHVRTGVKEVQATGTMMMVAVVASALDTLITCQMRRSKVQATGTVMKRRSAFTLKDVMMCRVLSTDV
jgi:transposase